MGRLEGRKPARRIARPLLFSVILPTPAGNGLPPTPPSRNRRKQRSAMRGARLHALRKVRLLSPHRLFGTSPASASLRPDGQGEILVRTTFSWSAGKRERDQGVIVLATRMPSVSNRTLALRLTRTAARTSSLSLRQEPPRTTRKLGSPPRSHADPSVGARL